MAEQQRPRRENRRPPARLLDTSVLSLDEEPAAASQGQQQQQQAGSSRKRKAGPVSHPLTDPDFEGDADEPDGSDSGSESDEEPGNSSKQRSKAVRVVKTRSGRAAVARSAAARALSSEERAELAAAKRAKQNEGTQGAYGTSWRVWERWCENGGYIEGAEAIELDISEPTEEVVGAFARFLIWYANGRKGDPNKQRKGGNKVKGEKIASMNGVHAALQDGVKHACTCSGRPVYNLREQPDYGVVYALYCRKSAARSDQSDESVHISMSADDLVNMCHGLLDSAEKEDMRNLAMILYQYATVSRGDDVRPRKLSELMVRYMKSVGPSKCASIAVMQPQGAGKTLKARPAWKAFIRNRMPECCPVRALFAWLSCRFLLNSEAMPAPGDTDFLLFPGSSADLMSLSNHARIIHKIFAMVDIDPPKVTHEFRVFAAQALHDMGVSLEVIQRIGHWLLDSFGTAYIVPGFTPEALLALAFWPGAAQKDFTNYWGERFHVSVPSQLVYLLMPGLDKLEATADELDSKTKGSRTHPDREAASHAKRLVQVLKMGAVVIVQDALELAEQFPNNPLHDMLLKEEAFRVLLDQYKDFKGMGGFEDQRPLSVTQRIEQLDRTLEQIFGAGQIVRCARPAARWLSVLDSQQLQQQQRSQHPKSSSSSHNSNILLQDVLQQLLRVAAGGQPSPQLQDTCAQLAAKLQADMDEHGLPFADWDAAADDDAQQGDDEDRDQGIAPQASAAAAPAAAAAAAAAASSQPAAGLGPPSAAAAGTPTRPQLPAFGQGGDAPASAHMTPSGQQYTRQQLGARNARTLSPGGHYTTFFSMQPAGERLQRTAQQTQHSAAAQSDSPFQQQQDALIAAAEQAQAAIHTHEEYIARLEVRLYELRQAGQLTEADQVQQLQQDTRQLQESWRARLNSTNVELDRLQFQQLPRPPNPLPQQQQQQQQPPPEPAGFGYEHAAPAAAAAPPATAYAAAGEGVLHRMGGHIDPVNDIFNPYTAQRGISLSAYAPSRPAHPAGGAVAAAAVVEAMHRLERKVDALAAARSGEQAAGAAAAAAAAGKAAGSPAAAAAQHAGSGSAAAGKAKQQQPFSFPNFGRMSVQDAAKWWCTPLADHITAKEEEDCKGWTPEQLQAEGKVAWRGGGHGPRYQRWAEWLQLMKYVAAKQFQLTQDKGAVVSLQEAAAAVDTERGSLSLTQLYKKVVKPWAAQQEAARKQQLQQQQEEEEVEEEEQS